MLNKIIFLTLVSFLFTCVQATDNKDTTAKTDEQIKKEEDQKQKEETEKKLKEISDKVDELQKQADQQDKTGK